MSAWTWEQLASANRAALEEVMRTGATPDIGQLLGHTYRGLNSGLVPRVTGEKWCCRTPVTMRWCSGGPTS